MSLTDDKEKMVEALVENSDPQRDKLERLKQMQALAGR